MNTTTFATSLMFAWSVLMIFAVLQLVRIIAWLKRGRIEIHHPEIEKVVVLDSTGTPLRYWMTIITNSVMDVFLWALVMYFSPRWWALMV